MPVHAGRILPGSERITSDIRGLVGGFDPARPLTYDLEFDSLPRVAWKAPYREIEVTVEEAGAGRAPAPPALPHTRRGAQRASQQRPAPRTQRAAAAAA